MRESKSSSWFTNRLTRSANLEAELTKEIDWALVTEAQHGSSNAFNALVSKYRTRILKLSLRYVCDPADAEDIVQDTFLKAFRAVQHFRGDCAFYSWLHRIATNVAKSAALTKRRDAQVWAGEDAFNDDVSVGSTGGMDLDTPEDLALTEEICRALSDSLEELSDEQRVAIMLREVEGLSYQQVALSMNCPVGTVRSRVFRAREFVDWRVRTVFSEGLGRERGKRRFEVALGAA